MQFALKDLFDAQQAKGGVIALTLNDYFARGGPRKALERHADAAFAKLSESELQLARPFRSQLIAFVQMVSVVRRLIDSSPGLAAFLANSAESDYDNLRVVKPVRILTRTLFAY